MKPLVSIIIANHNYGSFLPEAIESAIHQTWKNVQVIVVDDGSSDGSLSVASKYNVTLLSQENQGVNSARNNGAAWAEGEYILFLDADDYLFPDAIERLFSCMSSCGSDVAYAYGLLQFFGAREGVTTSQAFDSAGLSRRNYMSVTTLIRKKVFDAVGGFDRGMRIGEDWELYVRFWHAGFQGVYLPEPILHYRKHKVASRRASQEPKRLSTSQLVFLYPGFFWRALLRHPLRYLYYRWKYDIPRMVRQYGVSKKPPKRVDSGR